MKRTTTLRLIGGVGPALQPLVDQSGYGLEGIPVLLLTFGFAGAYEGPVVRPAKSK